jgi:aspartyl-tRNA(Asn)/glutamyl-tRNA(Gln) amidotransferase subunit A
VKGLRIGLPKEYRLGGLDREVGALVAAAVGKLEKQGAVVKEISLPHTQYAVETYYILASSEASSNLARFDGIRYGFSAARDFAACGALSQVYEKSRGSGFGPEVKRRIMLGTYALSSGYYDAYYAKAQKVRTLVRGDFENAFGQVDVIAAPSSPTAAFRLGEKIADPLAMYLSDVYTIPASLAGVCALSAPCGDTGGGLPAGLQLISKAFGEAEILKAAAALESCL